MSDTNGTSLEDLPDAILDAMPLAEKLLDAIDGDPVERARFALLMTTARFLDIHEISIDSWAIEIACLSRLHEVGTAGMAAAAALTALQGEKSDV